ncbi:hypothetical protein E0493_19185 [Roseomonas sp. M0104]|uniref:Squalene synthase HpnC n=1 Tax=Teichococcus coralli TaxID=2545983 RepID=A0A845BET3_9PROT|nr:squalene/phytoene synthase family protein [Pseudoroseomonas coralli]MXP65475.1 hypothetical protein [Pseudoroseomonas coralli]
MSTAGPSLAPGEVLAGPPTRGPGSENFPVASWLLAPEQRGKVLAFYGFVRAADDIADHTELSSAEKLARLDRLEAALDDPAGPLAVARRLRESGAGMAEARQMLTAFRQDAVQPRYGDWAALEDYCANSAVPVGRLLLRLHDETDPEALAAADALCTALQILNHLQDAAEDRARLDRVYLPQDWLALAGGEARFFADPAMRAPLLATALDRVDALLERAASLPRRLHNRRMALEAAVTLELARRLLARLRGADPLARRVALTRGDFARALLAAPRRGGPDAAVVQARVLRARSSFARGMAALHGDRRRALYAVYAFCRAVDDIADGSMPEAEKRRALADWRGKLDTPDCALSRELAWARRAFALPRAECEALIAGMEADAGPSRRIADEAALAAYCRQVAGSVGALAVRIFGAAEAEPFGLALGHAFQLVNVLRDLDEDAARDRVYLPQSWLAAEGLGGMPAAALVADPRLARVAERLAAQAEAAFAAAHALAPPRCQAALKPARIMQQGYRLLLEKMRRQGFQPPRTRVRLTRGEKLRLLWRAGS